MADHWSCLPWHTGPFYNDILVPFNKNTLVPFTVTFTFGSKLIWYEYLVHLNHILTPPFEHFDTIRPRWQYGKECGLNCQCLTKTWHKRDPAAVRMGGVWLYQRIQIHNKNKIIRLFFECPISYLVTYSLYPTRHTRYVYHFCACKVSVQLYWPWLCQWYL